MESILVMREKLMVSFTSSSASIRATYSLLSAHLIATLSAVQAKLAHLESENSISRRRVRELELELEECKKEVMRERTKILEQSSFHPVKERQQTPGKGLGRAKTNLRGVSFDPEVETTQKRYQEVVEEKKGQ